MTTGRMLYLFVAIVLLGSAAEGQEEQGLKLSGKISYLASSEYGYLETDVVYKNISNDTLFIHCVYQDMMIHNGVHHVVSKVTGTEVGCTSLLPPSRCAGKLLLPDQEVKTTIDFTCYDLNMPYRSHLEPGDYLVHFSPQYGYYNGSEKHKAISVLEIDFKVQKTTAKELSILKQFSDLNASIRTGSPDPDSVVTAVCDLLSSGVHDAILLRGMRIADPWELVNSYEDRLKIARAMLQLGHSRQWEISMNGLYSDRPGDRRILSALAQLRMVTTGERSSWFGRMHTIIKQSQEDRKAGR